MRVLYFYDKPQAKIRLVDGRLQIEAKDGIRDMVLGYREQFESDKALYEALPMIFSGYNHVGDEVPDGKEIKRRG